jgi:hypothetical protein
MDHFDFFELYKDHSTTDLLKIIKQPADYEPAVVNAATQILDQRQVSSEELEFVDQYFQDIGEAAKNKKEKIDSIKHEATEFLQPILHPSEKVEPRKWLNILLLFITVQYVWTLLKIIQRMFYFLKCNYCSINISFWGDLFTLLYVPVIFFLLFKRRRWGWILLFADNLFSFIAGMMGSYLFFKYQSIHHGSTISFILPILIRGAFVLFLWQNSIADFFGVNYETKKKTFAMITIGTLLFMFCLQIFLK